MNDYSNIRAFGEDFANTAALAPLMDIIISIDTSIAHVAAAIGRPTWILLPHVSERRWMQTRNNSPWYPTARLFRQPSQGDWQSVILKVAEAIQMFQVTHRPHHE
ncbi:MAG TPA: glycosyltransferase family 9 protein [Rhodocyclaceae bacterium]|nr:glycosyltransferase family 9 protein [Rhodocyclaceae bacterium]